MQTKSGPISVSVVHSSWAKSGAEVLGTGVEELWQSFLKEIEEGGFEGEIERGQRPTIGQRTKCTLFPLTLPDINHASWR